MERHYVGVDVGAKGLVVCIERSGTRENGIVFSNDAGGHRKLLRWATKKGATAQVVLESTGVYGLDLAFALHRAKRVDVMVANPRAIAAFAKASLQRSKTDALDAETILEFSMRMPFVSWNPPDPSILELRGLSRRIEAMSKTLTQERNRLHANQQSEELGDFKPFGLRTRQMRIGSHTLNGYQRSEIEAAYVRYCPTPPVQTGTLEQINEINDLMASQGGTFTPNVPVPKAPNPLNNNDCSGVPVREGGEL